MRMFRCACSIDGTTRCDEHKYRACHDAVNERDRVTYARLYGDCPPCFLARVRSVSLSAKATPTRGKR